MPTVTKSLGDGTQSVLLTVAILESLARKNEAVSISELAREIGTSKSRVFRHLQTLVSCEYVSNRGASGEYEVGRHLLALCRKINERFDLVNVGQRIMSDLVERLGHNVIVSRVDVNGVHVLKSSPGISPIVVGVRPGTVLPFGLSAQGKIALAFMASARREEDSPFAAAYRAFASEHPRELETIRGQGWASAQMRDGLNGIAAPVFDGAGNLIATLALLDTAADMGNDAIDYKTKCLMDAARLFSQELKTAGIRSA